MKVLVTGGAGFIGSHTVLEMLGEGHEVTVLDNMHNASPESLKRVQKLSGKEVKFSEVDLLDVPGMEAIFAATECVLVGPRPRRPTRRSGGLHGRRYDAVVHFAGLKAVGESVAKPLLYYENNIAGTVNLLNVMTKYNCTNIVFSSSATVYGDPASVPALPLTLSLSPTLSLFLTLTLALALALALALVLALALTLALTLC